MNEAKIQFSVSEMELMNNADIILTKNRVIQKIKSLFEDLQDQMIIEAKVDENGRPYFNAPGKISRGENYNGLPYLILDNPRKFDGKNIFTIRTMFWWGNFFSITLHLSGNNKISLLKKISDHISMLNENNFFVYAGQKEWEHDIDPNSYKKISTLKKEELEKIFIASNFLKLAIKFPIDSLEAIEDKLLRNYELLVKCCC
jgi:hypothetical protein